jgi:hypothetical protein
MPQPIRGARVAPFLTVDLTPGWWTKVRRDGGGAIPMALQFVVKALMKTDLRLRELRAGLDALVLEVEMPNPGDLAVGERSFDDWASKVVKTIEREITIEPADYLDAQPTVARADVEKKLTELGFQHEPPRNDWDADNWVFAPGGSANCYVRLSRTDQAEQRDVATWGDTQGERAMSFAELMAKLATLENSAMIDAGSPGGTIFDEPSEGKPLFGTT